MIKFKVNFIVDKKGKKTAVVISIKDYETLMEELHDLKIIAERREEGTIKINDFKKVLENDGII